VRPRQVNRELLVEELMSPDVLCVEPQATVLEVVGAMRRHSYSCVVVAQDKVPLGVITERDAVGLLAEVLSNPRGRRSRAVDIMSACLTTVAGRATLFEALVLSRTRKIRHLPVVDAEGRLSGLVTQSDLVRAHLHLVEEQRDLVERAVENRVRELVDANERLKTLALEDGLLAIGNRRAMEVDLRYTHEAARRYGSPYSVALFDVDDFKLYNDSYGHSAGDRALRRVADHLRVTLRKSDRLYRYGGEEILVVAPFTSVKEAEALAQRLVEGVADIGIRHTRSPFGVLTISCGVAGAPSPRGIEAEWGAVVCRADKALYRAKRSGKRTVATARQLSTRNSHPPVSASRKQLRAA